MENRVTHRALGDIPGCKQPGHTPTLLQQHGIYDTPEQAARKWREFILNETALSRQEEMVAALDAIEAKYQH